MAGRAQALPVFGFVSVHERPLPDGTAREQQVLAELAACGPTGRARAWLWQGVQGLVVPRSYERRPHWTEACAAAAARGWPVQVRASGGGLVPQGPGVWNLSLAWPAPGAVPTGTDAIYRDLCAALAAALARLGIAASPQTVAGSFCDGRYNLAVDGRKLVGTAQAWRRVGGVPMVLAHAVIVVSADPTELTARANAFEAAPATGTRYRADALTSVALATRQRDIEARTLTVLAEQFARVVPPRVFASTENPHGAA